MLISQCKAAPACKQHKCTQILSITEAMQSQHTVQVHHSSQKPPYIMLSIAKLEGAGIGVDILEVEEEASIISTSMLHMRNNKVV